MHELSIAMEIIDIVEMEAAKRSIGRIEEIGLKIGALTAVDPEALRFAFEASTVDTPLAGVKIGIEHIPVRGSCRSCGKSVDIREFVFICSHCGSSDLDIDQGEELDVAYIAGQ